MATSPQFTNIPKIGVTSISSGNSNRDGSGPIYSLFQGGNSGSRIEHIDIQATGTTTSGIVRLFINNGSNYFLSKEQFVSPVTPTATLPAFKASIDFSDLSSIFAIPSGYSVGVSTEKSEGFNVIAFGGDF